MIKYFKELENRDNIYLSLIDFNDNGRHNIDNYKLPLSFYIDNRECFDRSKELVNLFNIYKVSSGDNSYFTYEEHLEQIDRDSEYESIKESLECTLEEISNITCSDSFYYFYLDDIRRINELLNKSSIVDKNFYLDSKKLIDKAIKEIEKYKYIDYDMEDACFKKLFLDDSFFIAPNSVLYNTGGSNGHKETSLVYDYEIVKDMFSDSKKINGSKFYKEKYDEIKEYGVSERDFKHYLNYIYVPFFGDINNFRNHDKMLVDTIAGIVNAKMLFYRFFEDVYKYCDNPYDEFLKLQSMCSSDISDILVRCCCFNKIESQENRLITTSDLDYKNNLKEYINNGWSVSFIPPIIIQRDKKVIKELDMDSLFVKKYMKTL